MPITVISTKVEAFDETDQTLLFTLQVEDAGVHKLEMDTFVTLENLGELFAAIRVAVQMMDREKTVEGAE